MESIARLSKVFSDITNRQKNINELLSIQEENERKLNEEIRKIEEMKRICGKLTAGCYYSIPSPPSPPHINNPYIATTVVSTPVISTLSVVSTPAHAHAPVVSAPVVFEDNPFKPPALARFNIPSLKSPSHA